MLIDLIELACNNALEHDPDSKERLKRLNGKTIRLSIRSIGRLTTQHITISPHPHGLEFSTELSAEPDVSLNASLGALVKISRDGLDNAELQAGDLEINGDAIVGQRFAQILSELNIDWLGLMAEHLGEAPAIVLHGGISKAKGLFDDSKPLVKAQVNQFLIDDLQMLVSEDEAEPFLDAVDILRADADRLIARMARLQKLHNN